MESNREAALPSGHSLSTRRSLKSLLICHWNNWPSVTQLISNGAKMSKILTSQSQPQKKCLVRGSTRYAEGSGWHWIAVPKNSHWDSEMRNRQGKNTEACSLDSEKPLSKVTGTQDRDRYLLNTAYICLCVFFLKSLLGEGLVGEILQAWGAGVRLSGSRLALH